ncbi:threonylcarbamoyl-AMP synthase [Thermoactinomyces daqus]|jgi:L-threonylcarbamoyladenylate synthase|uniref:Threonylcarbamoyl-AMP synthase n=1 Tax=Thermoactinomyces daqus TaxID=1329516 RepID=A0A7W1X872_9BACL|nr:threonylcarbamoyl-AMP synthase [Thermoactinomyces daqus]MBH8597847.1 threonylcarbamoyl-AMP synthase [Thermoactinomyces sp. CICC 10523]MBH8604199.1 threonylcarbamoyl-AMP synthase [Thermoactinomyces sp. CICC 10522]
MIVEQQNGAKGKGESKVNHKETEWARVDGSLTVEALRQTREIREGARILREGGLVAFPTETVYGLGAAATLKSAVNGIFSAKGRPSDNPLIVHVGEKNQVSLVAKEVSPLAQSLIDRFWPGPLTIVVPHRGNLAENVTAGLSTVGIRMPDHPTALALLQETGLPVAAPSANRSGRPSPTEARHVFEDLAGRIDLILDGGPTGVGVESTVVDVSTEVPVLLRPGGITLEQLTEAVGRVEVDPGLRSKDEVPRAPGMKYRHYAPRGQMWLIRGELLPMHGKMRKLAQEYQSQGKRVGILTTEEYRRDFSADVVIACGRRENPASVARNLYHALREFDDRGVEVILAEAFPEHGLYHSVMNRLLKAAGGNVLDVGSAVKPDSGRI